MCKSQECLLRLHFRNNVLLQQCGISLTSGTNCFETRICESLGKKWTNYKVSLEFRPPVILRYCKGASINGCGVSVVLSWQLWVSTAPESIKCTSSGPSIVRSQSCYSSILLNTKSRWQEVSVLGYVVSCSDTVSGLLTVLSRYFRLTFLFVWKLLEHCIPHLWKPPTWIAPYAPLAWQQQRLLRDAHFLDVTPKNL